LPCFELTSIPVRKIRPDGQTACELNNIWPSGPLAIRPIPLAVEAFLQTRTSAGTGSDRKRSNPRHHGVRSTTKRVLTIPLNKGRVKRALMQNFKTSLRHRAGTTTISARSSDGRSGIRSKRNRRCMRGSEKEENNQCLQESKEVPQQYRDRA
jgi:hypothetical protein